MLTQSEFSKLKKDIKSLELDTSKKIIKYIGDNLVSTEVVTTAQSARDCVIPTRSEEELPQDQLSIREREKGFAIQTEQRSRAGEAHRNLMS